MANLITQTGIDPLQPKRHQVFSEFYRDGELDPCRGDYTRIMERFDPEVNAGTSHVMLLEQAVQYGPEPQAYLVCTERQDQTRIFCLHLPSRYAGSLDGSPTPWDMKSFAFLGEITQGFVSTIELPNMVFRTVANIRAKTSDYIVTHLDELETYGIPQAPAEEPDSTLITTRTIMYLPARYVPLLLNPSGYTLRQTWEILYPALVDADDLIKCNALIKWLRAVTMSSEGPAPAMASRPSSAAIPLTVPLADANLIAHRSRFLRQALPGLFTPPESLERAITQMAAAVTQNTQDNKQAREEKAVRALTPKLPSEKYSSTINILQEYLQVPDELNLPRLWHQWANCHKRHEFTVFTEELQAYARSVDAFSTCVPVASAKLVQDVSNFLFAGESADDIKTGIQPFVIADASSEHRQANLELARTYGLLQAGDHSVMLADLEALKAKEVQSIPVTYFELERNLGMFGNLLGTVLGTTHVLTTKYRDLWKALSSAYRMELQQVIDNKRYIKPAHILRSIQLVCFNWFYQRKARLAPQTPDFLTMVHNIVLNTYVLPHLPPLLYKLAYPKGPTTISLDTATTSSVTTALTSSGGSSFTPGSNSSVISGITIPTTVGSGTNTNTRTKGSHFANVAADTSLVQLVPQGVRIRDLMGNDPPPTLDNGQQVCLSFMLRGGCWSTCKRAASHTHTLNAAEKARLKTYLTTQAQKLNASTTPSRTPATSG